MYSATTNWMSSPASRAEAAQQRRRAREGDPGSGRYTVAGCIAFLVILGAVGFCSAHAAPPAPQRQVCLPETEFEKLGGKLVRTRVVDYNNLYEAIPWFFCDRLACYGSVTFEGEVGEDGAPRSVRITKNTWIDRPEEHAAVLKQRLLASRYAPPKLHGKPVCIKMGWQLVLKAVETTKKP